MNEQTDLDRLLTAWLTADAPIREPKPLLDRVLARTARTRRRPAWRIPERWFHVSTITTRVESASRFPWRTAAVAALLLLVLTLSALLIAGSRTKPVPAPFGPAHNGQILYTVDGDIVAIDAPGEAPRTILGGPTADSHPIYSPDGLRFLFVRGQADSTSTELWAANADGSNALRLAATPFVGWVQWSPDADVIAVSLESDRTILRMVATDGSGSTDIKAGFVAAEDPMFRPSDGRQMMFRAKAEDGTWGLYLIGRDGTNVRALDLDPGFKTDENYAINADYYFRDPSWSPDGSRLMYHSLEPDPASLQGPGFRIHIADISPAGAVTADRMLEFDQGADDEFAASWLPLGTGIVFRSVDSSVHRIFAADVSPGAPARDLGVIGTDFIGAVVSPDGRRIVVSTPGVAFDGPTYSVIDLATLDTTTFLAESGDFDWQRTAE